MHPPCTPPVHPNSRLGWPPALCLNFAAGLSVCSPASAFIPWIDLSCRKLFFWKDPSCIWCSWYPVLSLALSPGWPSDPHCCFVSSPALNSWMEPHCSILPGSVHKPCHQDPALPAMLRPCELCPSVLALCTGSPLPSGLPQLPALAVPSQEAGA